MTEFGTPSAGSAAHGSPAAPPPAAQTGSATGNSTKNLTPELRWTCIIVILTATFSAVGYLFFLAMQGNLLQYNFAVSLLCFALSTVSCLLFAATVEIKGTWATLGVYLAGPAVLWIVALYAFSKVFPTPTATPIRPAWGWVTYKDWKGKLGTAVASVFDDEQEIPLLLADFYFPGHVRPSRSEIQQRLFYFADGRAALVQHVYAVKASNGECNVYCHPMPTKPGSPLKVFAYTKGYDGSFEPYPLDPDKFWYTFDHDVDWFQITLFDEVPEKRADYGIIDIPKFVDAAVGEASYDFKVFSYVPLAQQTIRVWRLKPAEFSNPSDVPVWAKECHPSQPSDDAGKPIAAFLKWLTGRLEDKSLKIAEKQFLEKFKAMLSAGQNAPASFEKLPDSPLYFPSTFAVQRDGDDTIVITYQWEKDFPVPAPSTTAP